ncbi:MAG: PorP/SprF family type IX secretion system membrane protein [Crocinitomicaceae bacterium]|nr:PorP/SprF family type IX secretion system membrane protein [Crocinitomicaceae bacterium]
MRKIYLILVGLLLLHGVEAQDVHFSQTAQTPLLINPAVAGVFDGWERAIINHRNQWLGAGTKFMTTAIAVDANLGKTELNDKAYVGLGLMLCNDIGGNSKFGSQTGSLTLSGILPMGGSGHSLSAGIQGGFGQRKADLSNVVFMNQWNGSGFDPNILSGEMNTVTSFSYVDASAGLYYLFDGGQNSFSRNNDFKLQIGLAGYHLNAPQLKYTSGLSGEKLLRKYVGHLGVVADVVGSQWAIDASVLQFVQGGHYETILGMMMRYRFEEGTKITGMTQDAFIGFGTYFRVKDAIVPAVMIDWRGFQFGVSYDVTVSKLRTAYTGSLEFSLSYRNLDHALFKTKARRF